MDIAIEENDTDRQRMGLAIEQAKLAARIGEVPVGAVIFRGGELVSTAYNSRETDKTALAHAELTAIARACERLGGWRLHECDLYVTLEPCPMCTGAIINARIRRIIFGAYDPKAGCLGSVCDLTELPFNHRPRVTGGVMESECAELLKVFFSGLRKKRE
jgi:tRNA(adenine34) deaminase